MKEVSNADISIVLAITVGIVLLIAALWYYFVLRKAKSRDSNPFGCLFAMAMCGCFFFPIVKTCMSPKRTIEIHEVNSGGGITSHLYQDYFEPKNGERITYEKYKEHKSSYYLYNNTDKEIVEIVQFYGNHESATGKDYFVGSRIEPGEVHEFAIEPDYKFSTPPSSVSVVSHHGRKIESTSKTYIQFADVAEQEYDLEYFPLNRSE